VSRQQRARYRTGSQWHTSTRAWVTRSIVGAADGGAGSAYEWKKDDAVFSAKWDEAVATSLDKLEGKSYELGINGDRQSITDTLKARRPEVWGNNNKSDDRVPGAQTNFFLNVTLQEQLERQMTARRIA
jgi:hypothetical protein